MLRIPCGGGGGLLGVDGGERAFVEEAGVFLDEELRGAGDGEVADFRGDGEGAEGLVVGDFFDQRSGGVMGLGFGQIEAGDLQAIEQKTGAAGVDLVCGDALEDLTDGVLDGGAVFRRGDGEAGAAFAAGAAVEELRRGDGAARGVVVVAELLAAQGGAEAAAAVGEDVAAVEAKDFRLGLGVRHDETPLPGGLWAKS